MEEDLIETGMASTPTDAPTLTKHDDILNMLDLNSSAPVVPG